MIHQVLVGDVLDHLRAMAGNSVHCVITSPPYWGLRNYGIEGQLGLEASPWEYLDKMVAVFREVRRVLRPDGTLWLNMGDCHISNPHGNGPSFDPKWPRARDRSERNACNRVVPAGLKHKDLVMMPHRLAIALQDDGWYVRMDNIWHKPSPTPESVRDRPTKTHEYVFLMAKSRRYFYDQVAVMEPVSGNAHSRGTRAIGKNSRFMVDRDAKHEPYPKQNGSFDTAVRRLTLARNKRSVWRIASRPFKGAHFATFPEALVEPCILAGTSDRGCCSFCGSPWARIVERPFVGDWHPDQELKRQGINRNGRTVKWTDAEQVKERNGQPAYKGTVRAGVTHEQPIPLPITLGWRPGCSCTLGEIIPCTVLDPFGGSGTTAAVAARLGRSSILIELKPEYAEMERLRIESVLNCASPAPEIVLKESA